MLKTFQFLFSIDINKTFLAWIVVLRMTSQTYYSKGRQENMRCLNYIYKKEITNTIHTKQHTYGLYTIIIIKCRKNTQKREGM